jgi:hypothetical protein
VVIASASGTKDLGSDPERYALCNVLSMAAALSSGIVSALGRDIESGQFGSFI